MCVSCQGADTTDSPKGTCNIKDGSCKALMPSTVDKTGHLCKGIQISNGLSNLLSYTAGYCH